MTTSAPVRKEHDIPIVKPRHVPADPRQLPQPDPARIVVPMVPMEQPVRQPERVRV